MIDRFTRGAEQAKLDLGLAGSPQVAAGAIRVPRRVFLTGATGFLGIAVLARLLEKTDARVFCLVRDASAADARARLDRAFVGATGRHLPMDRVEVVGGDLGLPMLGMTRADADQVAAETDAAIHCGADVNWSRDYAALRPVNVLSVLEIAKLSAQVRPKPLLFVSTLAVCYAHGAPEVVDEDVNMVQHLAGMPLAYAQGKCVAERVLHDFAHAGLPVTVVRSGLIVGDSKTGRSNRDDIVSRMLCSAAFTGLAPDVDWRVDACPVDFVADVLVGLSKRPVQGVRTLHVHHPTPRHWREVIAWLNVAGYRCSLVPYEVWLEHVRLATQETDHNLRPLQPFFLARPSILGGQTLPELYFEANRERIAAARSRAYLARRGMDVPTIDGAYLARCVGALAAGGHIPALPRSPKRRVTTTDVESTVVALLREHFAAPKLQLAGLCRREVEGGIISELLKWRLGNDAGVAKLDVRFRKARGTTVETLRLILKRKPGDDLSLAIGEALAATCGETLGKLFRTGARGLGLLQAHKREPVLYRIEDPRLRKHMPRHYGSMRESNGQLFALAIECLAPAAFPSWAEAGRPWHRETIRSVVEVAAQMHSVFLAQTHLLGKKLWQESDPPPEDMLGLWQALAGHASEFFSDWWGESSLPLQHRAAKSALERRNALAAMPRTLIHNDFNPRNLAFRPNGVTPRPCAFDWELAAVRVPQHDLAELLCFVLPPDADRAVVVEYLELLRSRLEPHAQSPFDRVNWFQGFALSLDELILERLPLYTLFHRIRRQAFLPVVLQNWRRLRGWFDPAKQLLVEAPSS